MCTTCLTALSAGCLCSRLWSAGGGLRKTETNSHLKAWLGLGEALQGAARRHLPDPQLLVALLPLLLSSQLSHPEVNLVLS